ncbi:AAA family ATPase [Marinobacterium sp. YM272]|uniref:AAA family ATPase n=1 Tax=Marinobacterium sp. YM272 TaxID=3421654 RepID=UPI003D7F45DD
MDLHNLKLKLKDPFPIVVIETHDERRVVELLRKATFEDSSLGSLKIWSAADGLDLYGGSDSSNWQVEGIDASRGRAEEADLTDPLEMLKKAREQLKDCVLLLPDFHGYLNNPMILRLVKEIAQQYFVNNTVLVFVSHSFEVPAEIERMCTHFELAMPSTEEITALVKKEARAWSLSSNEKLKGDPQAVDLLIRNLIGLTEDDARRFIRGAIHDDGAITHSDIKAVMDAKYRMLSRGGAISYSFDLGDFAQVGGFKKLKSWLELRKPFFVGANKQNGFDLPKGVMLIGVQGCGKSLAAKAIAGVWGVPLLKLDFGALFNKYIGETEKNLRDALKSAEMLEPCVLWMDEIEKGISSGQDESGTSSRVLGTLLTWMAENRRRVFVVATANDIEKLPPELLRKGRLDEIYFVDLPGLDAREQIFVAHLQKRDYRPEQFELERLSEQAEGFSGAEIEQAIVSAGYWAHSLGEPLNTAHIFRELGNTQPLSVVRAESVAALRRWAEGRTVSVD